MGDDIDDENDDIERKHDKQAHDKQSLAIQNIMQNEGGRDFIWDHLQSCCVFESIFDTDPVQTGYNSGMRDAGLRLERVIKEHAKDNYLKMIKENI